MQITLRAEIDAAAELLLKSILEPDQFGKPDGPVEPCQKVDVAVGAVLAAGNGAENRQPRNPKFGTDLSHLCSYKLKVHLYPPSRNISTTPCSATPQLRNSETLQLRNSATPKLYNFATPQLRNSATQFTD